MSLSYIIDQVCETSGYDPVNDREFLVVNINRAAKEVYEKTDLPGCLREITVLASAESVIALPHYIGELRAMRSKYTYMKVPLREMAPKYNYKSWLEIWNNWRVLKKSPLKNSIVNASLPIILSLVEVSASDITIRVTGSTLSANRVTEEIIIAAGEDEVQLANNFTDIISITKAEIFDKDITFTGFDANSAELELSVLYNDQLNALYTLVDVSKLPNGGDNGTNFRYVEVLYKEQFQYLSEDGQEFQCPGYDDAIVCKFLEHFFSSQENGSPQAVGYYKKCNQIISEVTDHTNGASEKEIQFVPNAFLGLYPRFARGRRYSNGYYS
jgi:hypothetical protein